MSVCYCDNSGMVDQLCGYEGVSTLESVVVFSVGVVVRVVELLLGLARVVVCEVKLVGT